MLFRQALRVVFLMEILVLRHCYVIWLELSPMKAAETWPLSHCMNMEVEVGFGESYDYLDQESYP